MGVIGAKRRAGIERDAGDALDPGVELRNVGCLRESCRCCRLIADIGIHADIRDIIVQADGVGGRSRKAGDERRQRLIIDDDLLGGVACHGDRLGNDHRDRFAHMAHAIRDEQRVRRDPGGDPSRFFKAISAGGPSDIGVCGIVASPSAITSKPVSVARTPGILRARRVSIARMRAWACGERTETA